MFSLLDASAIQARLGVGQCRREGQKGWREGQSVVLDWALGYLVNLANIKLTECYQQHDISCRDVRSDDDGDSGQLQSA